VRQTSLGGPSALSCLLFRGATPNIIAAPPRYASELRTARSEGDSQSFAQCEGAAYAKAVLCSRTPLRAMRSGVLGGSMLYACSVGVRVRMALALAEA
jgi:hypothetical protein